MAGRQAQMMPMQGSTKASITPSASIPAVGQKGFDIRVMGDIVEELCVQVMS